MFTICLRVISGLHFEFIHNFPSEYILDIFGRNLKFVPDVHLKYDHNFSFENIKNIFKIGFQYKPGGNFDCNLPHLGVHVYVWQWCNLISIIWMFLPWHLVLWWMSSQIVRPMKTNYSSTRYIIDKKYLNNSKINDWHSRSGVIEAVSHIHVHHQMGKITIKISSRLILESYFK